jgi:hypothetical protein
VTSPEDFGDLEERRLENLSDVLWESHRRAVPIRVSFLQVREEFGSHPGPLGEIVRKRYHHALDVYLLILAATASPPHRLHVNPDFWATLVRRPAQSLRNARLALYRSLDILDSLDLVRQETRLGMPTFQVLDESGKGELYFHPATKRERYLRLPHTYWEHGFDRLLDLPGKAVLLLARSSRPLGFTLPLARSMEWYGISADTLRRGMDELIRAKLVRYTKRDVPSPRAPRGTSVRRTYVLVGSMARTADAEDRSPPVSRTPMQY